jgi:hypothetical protein
MFPIDHQLLFALIAVLFSLWGMSNNLTDILVQQFKKSFELTQFTSQLVQTGLSIWNYSSTDAQKCRTIPALMRKLFW